jgi:hypothetical protein
LISLEQLVDVVDADDSSNAGAVPSQINPNETICLPNTDNEKENDAELLLRWDLDAPQELNRPKVDDEVRPAVNNSSNNVEIVSVDAVLGLDSHVPVGCSRATPS